ncbi:MAG: YraN family protein [Nitriliruptoraceae bacterium]
MDTTAHRLDLDPADRRALTAGLPVTAADLGAIGEGVAARHLRTHDRLRPLARNWRVADGELRGELDVIAVDEATTTLVVCEVKTRRAAEPFGGAVAALDHRKHRRLRALTAAFLREQPTRYAHVRIDLIAIDLAARPSLTHLIGLG